MIYFIIIYVLSVILGYRYIRLAHSTGGIYDRLKIDALFIFCLLIPLLNTGFYIGCWLFIHPIEKTSFFNADKFFRIKR